MIKLKRIIFIFIAILIVLIMLNTIFIVKTNTKINNKSNNQKDVFYFSWV